jgi:septum formation protein
MTILPRFVLASASPARRQLLETVGIMPEVQVSGFDESTIQSADPADLVQKLSSEKARRVASQRSEPALIMGCDSILTLNGEVHGKPANAMEAIARWRQMRGNTGHLYTGHALIDQYRNKTLVYCHLTRVKFAMLSDRQIEAYVNTGEPLHCAGCFALDGKGGLFVEEIIGCHTNVIGLSLPLLRRMLAELNYDITDFWH